MRCLVTGGAGFIGGHLSESLLKAGHQVVVIDNLSTGSLDNIKHLDGNPNFEFIKEDILDLPYLDYLVSKTDMIFHLAAAVGVELVVHDPVRTILTNVHGTEAVLNSAVKYKKKILIASTSEVYGKSSKVDFSESDDLLIGPSVNSRWSYACSKLLDEFLGLAFQRQHGLPVIVVRLFNTVGPRQTGQYGMVVPRFVQKALINEPLQVYGTGDQTRCFCHVFDTVRALIALSQSAEAEGKVFNIGGTHSISIHDLAKLVIKHLGSQSKIELIPYDQAYEEGFEDMMHRKPHVENIKRAINWEAQLSLEQIIDDVAACSKRND